MLKVKTIISILLILSIHLIRKVNAQILPSSPCPTIFQFRYDGIKWFGRLRIEQPPANVPLHLKVTLSIRGNPLSNYLGEIELLTRGRPVDESFAVFYNVRFPLTSGPPKLISVSVNNRTICVGPQDYGVFVTLIHLEHTREFSFFPNQEEPPAQNGEPITGEDESSRKLFLTASKGSRQQLQRLNDICGLNDGNQQTEIDFEDKDHTTTKGFWPWLAAIYVNNYTSLTYICSGSVVSHNVIVTAAHCFHIYQKKYFANEVLVFLGRHNLQNWNEEGSVVSPVDNIFIHPNYDNNLSSYDADIAVLILKMQITFNQHVKPVCLWNEPKSIRHVKDTKGYVVGWGVNEQNLLSTRPKMLQAEIVTNSKCIDANKKYGTIISSQTFCAGGDLPCVGYSGAGLMLYRNGKWRLRGIVSASLPGSCKSNKYVIYTDASKFLDWIYAFII